ncbi:MAG: hypothetical protein OXG65_16440 [Chloroflexi bacterium]|nr:hypothetical protein [Chloroflexota bacterium]
MSPTSDRTHESVVNDALARLLRERVGLTTAAETMHGRARPDVLVRREDGPVVIETELEPARTVDADALSRLGLEIDGQAVQTAFAVTVPGRLREVDQRHLGDRLAAASDFEWREWRIDGTAGPRLSGNLADLGNAAARAEPPASNLEAAVDELAAGVRRAGSRLYRSQGALARVADTFSTVPGDETAHMAALVITNAMLFQEGLSDDRGDILPVDDARVDGRFERRRLLAQWDYILEIDYYPIFSMARAVVSVLSGVVAADVLDQCAHTAARLLALGSVGRHDLAGRIFNQLIAERKLLAAYYTSIPAATLLAGLALAPQRWPGMDWSDSAQLRRWQVVDPACGTGTLLMAAYQQIMQNRAVSEDAAANDAELHTALLEHTLFGADVVQSAIHITAATLAAMSPSVGFGEMQLHSLIMGVDTSSMAKHGSLGRRPGDIKLGSLDWLHDPEAQSSFSATREQVGAKGSAGKLVQRPRADLVISNPPFTRRGSDGGKGEALARVLDVPEGDAETRSAVARQTSTLLKGTPANQTAGHAASFTVLADRLVRPDGRLALVLPVTALAGESWRQVRAMLARRYAIELVVSSHDPEQRSMSYDTSIAEVLLVARRLRANERPPRRGRFVNLWRAPKRETEALALANAVNAAAAFALHHSDGPPVGGIPLIVGGEQWGELQDGPVDDGPWTASRWKQGQTGQFAAALERGELWAADGSRVVAQIPIAPMADVCHVGPQDRRIRGSIGVFDAYHGWDEQAQFPALWAQSQKVHQGLLSEPNARLIPQPGRDYRPIWSQAGTLQMTRDVRYNSQRVMTVRTNTRTLGIRAWFTLASRVDDPSVCALQGMALTLWCNSTLGLLLHSNHANRAQHGRGTGNKGMLETLPTLDVRQLEPWQLDEAQAIYRDFQHRTFESFHRCSVDSVRVDLDHRIITDLLALPSGIHETLTRIRTLLATDPSIHGSKRPELRS